METIFTMALGAAPQIFLLAVWLKHRGSSPTTTTFNQGSGSYETRNY